MTDWRTAVGLIRSAVVYTRPGRARGLRRLYAPWVPRPPHAPGATDAERPLVFDVGAHLGDRTRAFAQLGARVVALEPQPLIRRWLIRRSRSLPHVTVRPEAVGRAAGHQPLAVSRTHPSVSSLSTAWTETYTAANGGFDGVTWEDAGAVPVTTLDALIATYGVPVFCKIDVEGFEAEVLAGLSTPLIGLSFEFVRGAEPVTRACLDELARLGPYEYNAVAGEQRHYQWGAWQSPEAVRRWIDAGADGIPSGDLYARLGMGA